MLNIETLDLAALEREAFVRGDELTAQLAAFAIDADVETNERVKELEEELETAEGDLKESREEVISLRSDVRNTLDDLQFAVSQAKRIGNRADIELAIEKLIELVS